MQVCIATPTYDNAVCVEYAAALTQTVQQFTQAGVGFHYHTVGGTCFVDRARNTIAKYFLSTDCTDLLFIDADIGWDTAAIGRFMSHDVDIVVGIPCKRNDKQEYHAGGLTGRVKDGLFEAKEVPTAFMRIRRRVFDELLANYEWLRTPMADGSPAPFFLDGIQDGRFVGEDIAFCRLWTALGHSVWIDPDITFTHRGGKAWTGNFYDFCVKSGALTQHLEGASHGG